MNKENFIARVKRCIIEQLGVCEDEVTFDTEIIEDLGADSLDQVELVMLLEEEFDVEISDEDAGKCLTFLDILKGLNKKEKYGFSFVSEVSKCVYDKPILSHSEVPSQIVPENNVDAIETQSDTIVSNEEKDAATAHTEAHVSMFQQMQKICEEHNVNIEFTCKGEVYVQAEDDYTYKIKDEKQLTQLLDAVKLLESFKEV